MRSETGGSTNPTRISSNIEIASDILPTIPAPPTLISPGSETSPGPAITSSTPTFEWTEVSEAMEYGIYIRDLIANVIVFNSMALGLEITGSSYSLPPGILEMGKTYCWIMTSKNSFGLGYYGKIFHFQTKKGAPAPTTLAPTTPAPPTLISPGSEIPPGSAITTSTLTFEWTEVSAVMDYGIYIRDLTANALVFNSQELGIEITGSSYSLPLGFLKPGRGYMWSMKSHNSAGWGILATLLYFQT